MSTTTQPVLEMELKPRDPMALSPVADTPALNIVGLIERLAANPDFDVTKLQQLIDMQERILASQARTAFTAAFAVMQQDLPVIAERGKTNNGKYAVLEDIIETVRPILARHGFSLSHRTEWPDKGTVKIVGILAHRDGHERTSEFLSSADSSGNKNAIQGLGSAVSYGRRYTTKDLLNIVTREEDDDARRAGATAPDGFDEWMAALTAKAQEGLQALQAMWETANKDKDLRAFACYMTQHHGGTWNELKKTAAKVRGVK